MKQATQKFLAKLLVLVLVLGLIPEVWGTVAYAAGGSTSSGNNQNYIYYYGSDTNPINSVGSGVSLSTYYNGSTHYNNRASLCVVQNSARRTDIKWGLSGTNATTTNGTISNGIVSLTYSSTTGVATITGIGSGTCTVYAYAGNNTTAIASCPVYVDYNYNGNALASVSVYSGTYYRLGDNTSVTASSVVSQLISRVSGYNYNTGNVYVQFYNINSTYGYLSANMSSTYYLYSAATTSGGYLGNVTFTPTGTGTSSFHIRLYYGTGQNDFMDGYIYISTGTSTVSGGDITYTGTVGENVYFDVTDFDNFYSSKTGGTLSSVTFSLPSSSTGTLYTSSGTRVTSSGVSRSNLDNVYFQPYNNYSNTVRINFTAYGSWGYNYGYGYGYGYGYNNAVTGTVVINFINNTARDITYTPVGGSVKLNSSDFTSVYRDAVGSTAPSNLTIRFQNVPAYGTLTYNSTTLRSSSIQSQSFTTSQLNSITYTASGTRSDSVEYVAYTNGTARYTGKVVFNPNTANATVIVTKPCGSTGLAFNLSDFTVANPNVMLNTTQIRFSAPGYGTLTYGGSTVTANGVYVPVSSVSQVYYRPNAGFNSTDRVAFVCLDAAGNQVGSGQVNLVVTGNGTTTSSGTVTSINQLTDVSSTAWYRTELAELVSKGIMSGKGNGKFDPTGEVKYGEALKMILRAAGYSAEEVPGNNWAINYKNLAVSRGWISDSIVLTDNISRNEVAELAARVLGISASSASNPFTDNTANGYAIALYYNQQIIRGNDDGTFKGNTTLQRAEICVIIYRINHYVLNLTSDQMPDGI